MSAPSPPSTPPPVATAEQACALREDLTASGWGVESTRRLLGPVADDALRREIRLPALRAVRAALADSRATGAAPSPVAVLTALFMLGEPVGADELDAALPRTGAGGALAMGLVRPAGAGGPDAAAPSSCPGPRPAVVRTAVDLRPHEAVDDTGDVRWWIASDIGELTTGHELAPDHVLGIGGAGLTLAGLTPRAPVAAALDLGCGCGIQTLYLLRHADRVTATDISARALAFTAFNAALAGTGPDRLELVRGSLLEPLAGRDFDLIATNPPFVLTPPAVREAGLPLMEYRDAGTPVLPALVPAVGEHLRPGGTAVMLGNWEHHRGHDWRERVRAWLPDDLDAWVVQRERQDPVEYAAMWLRDGGTAPERDEAAFNARLGAWIDDFAARGIEAVGLGYLIVHRPGPDDGGREPWRVLEEVGAAPSGPLGEHVAQVIAARSRLAAMSDDDVAALHPVVAPDVTQERHLRPGASDPTVILIRQGGGLGRTVRADTALAALVDVADGELSVAQIAGAVAALTGLTGLTGPAGAEAEALRADLVAATRALAGDGFLTLR
ncbi:class I SAM-dependent methyltransferase [Actinomyces israelii]|uniref:class I SAM-dependent methyltransferase n=1 Tax=Actinomyces israelii TaxID=1659 RepID=UPI002356986C|nr:class I SAM-dependent methyltransferase [Actinomyces israelii]